MNQTPEPARATPPARGDFRHLERLRVRWAEIDAQQIVFNGHYLMYIDTAVAGYWRALAAPYASTAERLGGELYVRRSTLDYHASARYDELLDIGIRCAHIGNTSLRFAAGIFLRERLLVGGELVFVFADPVTQRPKPVPALFRTALDAFEAGEPMVEVRVGDWAALGADAHPIRKAVFVDEQGIPAEREWDAEDARAIHAVAYNRFGEAVAAGRLIRPSPQVGQIGRMAVVASMRGGAIGQRVLEALVTAAREVGCREVLLHAQASAAAFYRRAGFAQRGEPFEEVGIAHVEMACAL